MRDYTWIMTTPMSAPATLQWASGKDEPTKYWVEHGNKGRWTLKVVNAEGGMTFGSGASFGVAIPQGAAEPFRIDFRDLNTWLRRHGFSRMIPPHFRRENRTEL